MTKTMDESCASELRDTIISYGSEAVNVKSALHKSRLCKLANKHEGQAYLGPVKITCFRLICPPLASLHAKYVRQDTTFANGATTRM